MKYSHRNECASAATKKRSMSLANRKIGSQRDEFG
jgi:hypothetical protein